MTADQIVLSFAGGVFLLLVMLLAWIGARLHSRVDVLATTVTQELRGIRDLLRINNAEMREEILQTRDEISSVRERVTVIEAKHEAKPKPRGR